MTSTDIDPWAGIPRPVASGSIRLAPLADPLGVEGAGLGRGRDADGNRLFILNLDGEAWPRLRSPSMAGIDLTQRADGSGATHLILRLLEAEHASPFASLCDDIRQSVAGASSASHARESFIARTASWMELLRRGRRIALSQEGQMGLIGELVVLRDLLIPALGAEAAVAAWTGPGGAPKDFEVGGIWIEAKSFGVAGRREIRITSEHQLDDRGSEGLFLHVVPTTANAPPSAGGMTLPEWIDAIRGELLSMGPSSVPGFDDAVSAIGFEAHHDYETAFAASAPIVFAVRDHFPRIVAGGFPEGPRNLSYDLPLSAIADHEIPVEEVRHLLSAARVEGGHGQ